MNSKTKNHIRSMIKSLERFESHQTPGKIPQEDWEELSLFIADKEGIPTWNEISNFKDALKEAIGQSW